MSDVAISCQRIVKMYPMYDNHKDRFKEALHPFRKIYHKNFYALNNVSFDIYKGETVGIIGKNGAGKSTLLKIITGVLTPSSGSVTVNGVVSSLLELGTGFNLELTGIENIYVNASLMGLKQKQIDQKLQNIIEFADIGEHINQPVRGYSSGMFARLAFAVAISVEPDILIVDEALSVGDMNFQAKCMTAMRRIQDKGTTILFVSHDISSVKSLCEKCIYIESGVVRSIGSSRDVTDYYIRDMREKLNSSALNNNSTNVDKTRPSRELANSQKSSNFKESEEFNSRVASFRYGSGYAKITYVELIDHDSEPVLEVSFNQTVKVRIYIECYSEMDVAVNFQIFDDKKINITAGGFKQQSEELLKIKSGDRYIVDYMLKLPLQEGCYSIQANISSFVEGTDTPIFHDCVPDAYVFKVGSRPNFPIWSKVDLFPKLTFLKVDI